MRVVHVASGARLAGDLGRSLAVVLAGLHKRGFEVVLVTTPNAPSDLDQHFTVIRSDSLKSIHRAIASQYADIVHLHAPFPAGELAVLLQSTPSIVSSIASGPLDALLRHRGRLILEPLALDLENLDSPDDLGVAALRQAYKPPIALCILSGHPSRGVDRLLDAWSRHDMGTLLLLLESANTLWLRERISTLRLTPRVAVLDVPSPERQPNVYHAADLFIEVASPVSSATLNRLEAQASGLPVLRLADDDQVSQAGIITVNASQSIADALRALTDDAELREQLGRASSELVRSVNSAGAVTDELIREYESLLGK